ISARSATWPADSAGVAPSLASASIAPRERLYTCTVWPAANRRCVIGRPILPRPTKPASTLGRVLGLAAKCFAVSSGTCHPEGGTHALRSQARFAQGTATEGSASCYERRSRGSFASSHALRAPPGNENAP